MAMFADWKRVARARRAGTFHSIEQVTMKKASALSALLLLAATVPVGGQTFPAEDPVLRAIWEEGTQRSQLPRLAQTLMDSIGPRLNASPLHVAGSDWLIRTYAAWGVTARTEAYGTWRQWRRGVTHVDLLEPRVRSLEAALLAWSAGTPGPVTGGVVPLPSVSSPADFTRWLPEVRGNFVGVSFPQPTCRPDENWRRWALPETFEAMQQERARQAAVWQTSLRASGARTYGELYRLLEDAGAAGILTTNWPDAWGVSRVFNALTEGVPVLDLSCEDYGLVLRLAQNRQGPVLRVDADAEWLGESPAFNTIATIPGSTLPGEYVMLSAHFDSWDGASGATDNGTGTITMMEAVRILRAVYPNPRRTILVGHWGGEEQGLNGSRAFVEDNPEVVDGLQVLLNQDNGTGRVVTIAMQGFTRASEHFSRWLAAVPTEISGHIELDSPGMPATGGTDHASFVCAGAPGFTLSALSWDYNPYTWHTNRDTYDKIVFDDVRNNAILVAMLAYLAAEDPERVSRDRRATVPSVLGMGLPGSWPQCQPPDRSWEESTRVR
jgi:carboxypeptidase Q